MPESNPLFPVKSVPSGGDALAKALPELRRPFTPNAIKWKIQSSGPKDAATWAMVVGYIDARLVAERLNLVCGGDWIERVVERDGNTLLYELKVFDHPHFDVGVGQGSNEEMKRKGMHSDGLKRAAVRFGVGVSLYAMPQLFLHVAQEEHEEGGSPTLRRLNNGKPGRLKPIHEAWLREKYQEWLDEEGIKAFGEPLDHGDAPGSVGPAAEGVSLEESEKPGEERPEPLEDEKANGLRKEAQAVWAAIQDINPDALSEARFKQAISAAAHSHEELEGVLSRLEILYGAESDVADITEKLRPLMSEADLKALLARSKRRGSPQERRDMLAHALAEIEAQELGEEPSDG